MKIYYVANARMPTEKAHGIQIAKMCEALIEAGADVELIVPRRGKDAQSIKDFYGLRVDIPMARVWTPDWYGKGSIGFRISSCFFILGYALYLLQKKWRGGAGVIWVIDIDQFSFLAAPLLGMPYLAEIHDAKKKSWPFTLFFRNVVAIVVINQAIGRELTRVYRLPSEKILVCPNGIDLTMFGRDKDMIAARRALGLPTDERIALYAGKFYPWKGLGILADATAMLGETLVMYIVGGDADEFRQITGKAAPSRLRCVGARPYPEMPLWLAAADVLVVLGTKENDYSYRRTSPMKLFEYMASGRPIAASATPANRAIATSREAFFYEPDDAADLAGVLRFVLAHPEDARASATAARTKAEEFTWEKRVKSIRAFVAEKV